MLKCSNAHYTLQITSTVSVHAIKDPTVNPTARIAKLINLSRDLRKARLSLDLVLII